MALVDFSLVSDCLWNDVTDLAVAAMPELSALYPEISQWMDVKQRWEEMSSNGAVVVAFGTHMLLGIPHDREYIEYVNTLVKWI